LILGKTVTTEFAYFSPGPTRNPHNLAHTPGGSSSGSAAAVAAGLTEVALGTQTIGSIVRPAAFCGAVGLKPTHLRTSSEGVIPLSPSLDHVGILAPDVATTELVAGAFYEAWDPASALSRRPVLAVPEGPYLESASESGLEHFSSIRRLLADAGYTVVQIPLLANFPEVTARHDLILSGEAALVHSSWFEQFSDLYSSKAADLVARGKLVSRPDLQSALAARHRFRLEIEQTMSRHGIDLWIAPPACGPAPVGLASTGDPVMCLPWTQAGLPAIALPAGRDGEGMPLGLQLVGRWGADEALLSWAASIELLVRAA
jgi:Asp-tRNA(Asn)/Glu-tRNA(Gln) amidotransferase A subunit family amidase